MESSHRGRNALLTTLGLLALVAVVAIASRGSTPAGEAGARRPTDTLLDILLGLYIASFATGTVLLLYLMALRRKTIAQSGGPQRNWWNILGALLFIGAALLLARDFSLRRLDGEGVAGQQTTGTGAATAAAAAQERDPGGFAWITVSLTLGLIAVAIAGVWWSGRARRRARGELAGDPLADALAAAVDESLDDLRAESDPRRAVIAAYVRLERVLAGYGLPRKASEAPLEYLGRLLGEFSVSPPAARRLTALFERAKFSQHAVGPEMKEQAIRALETVRDDLSAARALAEAMEAAALEERRARAAG